MAVAEPVEKPEAEAARHPEPPLSVEQASVQGLSAQRKSRTTVELSLRRSDGQLPAQVDGSTAVAAPAFVSEARRDADRSHRRHSELLPHQGPLRRGRGNQRQHPNADQPGARVQEHALSTSEGKTHRGHQYRIRRFSENQKSRVECHFSQILAESPKNLASGGNRTPRSRKRV